MVDGADIDEMDVVVVCIATTLIETEEITDQRTSGSCVLTTIAACTSEQEIGER